MKKKTPEENLRNSLKKIREIDHKTINGKLIMNFINMGYLADRDECLYVIDVLLDSLSKQ